MLTKTIATAALAGGLAFGIGLPAQAAQAAPAESTCTISHTLVSPAVAGQPAVYGPAPLITPARAAWVERLLVTPAVAEVSHVVHHDAQYAERVVVDQPYVPAVAPVAEVSHVVHHDAETTTVHHDAVTTTVPHAAVTTTVHHDAVTNVVHHDAVTKVVHHDAVTTPVHHDAVTKVVHHDAVTKVVHHDAVTKVVHHDAVTKTVHHDAVTHTAYTRYSWVGGGRGPALGDTPVTQPSHWNADNKKYDGSDTGVVLHNGAGNGSYFYWAASVVVDKAAYDEQVVVTAAYDETVVVTPAYDETVVVTPAYDETVVVTPAYDEQVVVYPAYDQTVVVTPAWDETVVTPGWDETVVVTPAWDETVVVTPAWDETVVVTPAWDETVVDVPAQPGSPEQPEVSHVEYDLVTPAWDETVVDVPASDAVYVDVEHPAEAAVYGEPELISAAIPAQPAVYEDVQHCTIVEAESPADPKPAHPTAVLAESPANAEPAGLAETGGSINPAVPVGAGALIVGGIVALLLRRPRRSTQD
ncbi:MAG: hypothetical protein J0J05_12690 [Microbacterium sp.]|uniref:hypothetical protein n=1 Tax=Microbacterium sp. TaxID=51671 RepID=UPI001AC896F2|nr:hypothetical protein [Microbacterium sp.]MBN9154831.1 hypothetical protein [Microbacterium sp.]